MESQVINGSSQCPSTQHRFLELYPNSQTQEEIFSSNTDWADYENVSPDVSLIISTALISVMAAFSSSCPSRSAHYLTDSLAKTPQPCLLCCIAMSFFLSIPNATSIRILRCQPHAGQAVIVLPQHWINKGVTLKVQLVFNFLSEGKKIFAEINYIFVIFKRMIKVALLCMPRSASSSDKTGKNNFLHKSTWNTQVHWAGNSNSMKCQGQLNVVCYHDAQQPLAPSPKTHPKGSSQHHGSHSTTPRNKKLGFGCLLRVRELKATASMSLPQPLSWGKA